jgi:HlyD family secretion protein
VNARKRVLVIIVIAALAAIGYTIWNKVVEKENANTLTLYGNVDIREVELAFRVAGRLQTMRYDEGDEVSAGEVIAELDAQPYRESLAVAEARVTQAAAQVDKFKAGTRPQDIARAQAGVNQALAAYSNAESEYKRVSGLLETGASSVKARDAALARRDQAKAGLDSAREALGLAQEGFRSEDIAAAEADLAAAKAQQAIAETQLEDTRLVAPSNGTLISRMREPGATLGVGMPVYSLSLRDPVYVRAYVDEPHLGRLAPGAGVTVTTDSSDKVYEGKVGFISPRAEFTPRSVETTELRTDLVYRLRIIVDKADEGLRQGMPVTVHVPLDGAAG